MRRKLGLVSEQPDDASLIDALLELMQRTRGRLHQHLPSALRCGRRWRSPSRLRGLGDPLADAARTRSPFAAGSRHPDACAQSRRHSAQSSGGGGHQRRGHTRETSHRLETLLAVLSTPFDLKPEHAEYSTPPTPSERVYQTFCGT